MMTPPPGKILFHEKLTIGEFDPEADGAYRNVKTFPIDVKKGKRLYVSISSDRPIDMALSNADGICIKFKDSILNDTIGPVETSEKGTLTLFLGVFRGDKAEPEVKVWAE
jgi:hypothetical protein